LPLAVALAESHRWNYTDVIFTSSLVEPELLPCPRCGVDVVVVRVNRDQAWMRLNSTPDPNGEAILLPRGNRAVIIPQAELLAALEDRTRLTRANAETQARRYRDHAKTCRGYRVGHLAQSSCGAVSDAQLDRLRVLRSELELASLAP
jgi:hypothetical protein